MLPDISLIEKRDHPRPQDKRAAINWARGMLGRNEWVILDTESTGIGETAEIVQIGILSPDDEVLLNTYVRPVHRKRIPADATRTHGIKMSDLRDAPTMEDLLPSLRSLLTGKTVITYNAEFRARILQQTITRNCCHPKKFPVRFECAMVEYARYAGEWWQSKRDYKWQKLPGGDHSALGDCRATLALIRKMANAADATETKVVPLFPESGGQSPARANSAAGKIVIWVVLSPFLLILLSLLARGCDSTTATSESPGQHSGAQQVSEVPSPRHEHQPNALIGQERSWIPRYLPGDIKATLTTTLRDEQIADVEFFLSGPTTSLETVQSNPKGKLFVWFVDRKGKHVSVTSFASEELSKDANGNLCGATTFQTNLHEYARMANWKLSTAGFATASTPHQTIATQQNESPQPPARQDAVGADDSQPFMQEVAMPPVAPDARTFARNARGDTSYAESRLVEVARCEATVFGRTCAELPLPQRLYNLESVVFRRTFEDKTVPERIDNLQGTIFGQH